MSVWAALCVMSSIWSPIFFSPAMPTHDRRQLGVSLTGAGVLAHRPNSSSGFHDQQAARVEEWQDWARTVGVSSVQAD